jgi:hypothetical protein
MTDPRPEVAALAEAIHAARYCDDSWDIERQVANGPHATMADDGEDHILAHLPGSWRLVDMDELVERVARHLAQNEGFTGPGRWERLMVEDPTWVDEWRAEARHLLDGEPR